MVVKKNQGYTNFFFYFDFIGTVMIHRPITGQDHKRTPCEFTLPPYLAPDRIQLEPGLSEYSTMEKYTYRNRDIG